MDAVQLVLLFVAVGVIAFLYSTVGHAGASGYIAAMRLWGIAPSVIRPTALLLNIPVAAIGAFQFWLASREPPFSGGHNFVIPGGRPDNECSKPESIAAPQSSASMDSPMPLIAAASDCP